jgi:tripartite-type tricarboxylate transporter receptor subunit TctC
MKKTSLASLILGVAALALTTFAAPAAAQKNYPNKPIRVIVPYPPGGASDVLARLVGRKLSDSWGQPVVVENRPGATGTIGADALVRAPADGYTLLLVNNTHAINGHIYPKLPYDTLRDFAPVATFASVPFIMVANPSLPASDLRALVADAKARPGQLNLGIVANAGLGRISSEIFADQAGIQFQKVPYGGSVPLMADLLGGQVDFALDTTNVYVNHIKNGKVKPLAISAARRSDILPGVPTFAEAGLPDFDARMWLGFVARSGTPPEVIAKLSAEIGKVAEMPDVLQTLAAQGFASFPSSPVAFADLLARDSARYARVIKAANIVAE